MKKRKLLLVEFLDIGADNQWFNEKRVARDGTPVQSWAVGWKMESENKKVLNLSSFRNELNRCCSVTSIPKGCITKITELTC